MTTKLTPAEIEYVVKITAKHSVYTLLMMASEEYLSERNTVAISAAYLQVLGDACAVCKGIGQRVYPSSRVWLAPVLKYDNSSARSVADRWIDRRTSHLCDSCWGTGHRHHSGPNLLGMWRQADEGYCDDMENWLEAAGLDTELLSVVKGGDRG
jgi:hypothetical protein